MAATRVDVAKACRIWVEYQQSHDVNSLMGKTAGIDPTTGRVWFGEDISDIVDQMDAENAFTPLYFVRVGHDYYERKGGRR